MMSIIFNQVLINFHKKDMKYKPASLIGIVLLICSCRNTDTKMEGERLMQISREWSKTAGTDSVDRIVSYWADDAIVMSPGQPPVKGKNAIKEMILETAKIPGFKISWEPISVSVSESGDMAYLIEQNQITVNDSLGRPVTEHNKSVTIWRKEAGGTWKNVVDIWNASPR
jgi:ketosteroid isomerase-like protein